MLKKAVITLILGILFFPSVQAEELISTSEAKEVAQILIERSVAYFSAHPQEPGNIPEWERANLGDPILVHTYPDLKPCYYVVPVIDSENKIISLVGTNAEEQEWQWFSLVQLEKFPGVSENRANQICEQMVQNAGVSEPRIVEMPNKRLYWLYLVNDGNLKEIFINIENSSEVYTHLDPGMADLTTRQGPTKIHRPHPAKVVGSSEKHGLLYPEYYDIEIPFYYQETSWYCCEASLEMIFDYWGPDISQDDIGDAANDIPFEGTYIDDVRRASHFSYISTAIQNPLLQGYNERDLGYSGNEVFWSDPDHYPDRYDDLKNLISNDYPILVATWYSASHNSGHCRVLKGYDDRFDHFIVHDPWYSYPYSGPNVHFNQQFFVDDLWEAYDRWGLFSAPWRAELSVPPVVYPDEIFTVNASLTYTAFHPFEDQFQAYSTSATINLPSGYFLMPTSPPTIDFGTQYSGFVGDTSWQVLAVSDSSGPDTIRLEVRGQVLASSSSYPSYEDWLGIETEAVTSIVLYGCGDLNRDHVVDLGDVVFLINYLFRNGIPPEVPESGDVNSDDVINLGDVVYLINYLYRGGLPPNC